MDEVKKVEHMEGFHCNSCCGHGWNHHSGMALVRWLLGLLLLVIVFAIGVKVGEFKDEMGTGSYGRHMMWGNSDEYRSMRAPVMLYQGQMVPQSTTTKATTTTPSKMK